MTNPSLPADAAIHFSVAYMSCGHCVKSITAAVKGVDAQADVAIDLATHQVSIRSARSTAGAFSAAISEAGFTPTPSSAANGG